LEKTLEVLSKINDAYRKRMSVYSHIIYSGSTDGYVKDKGEKNKSNIRDILDVFREKVFDLGYNTTISSTKTFFHCEAEMDYFWCISPDGDLTKCTLAIEKDRAQAHLTEDGVKILPSKLLNYEKKEKFLLSSEKCKDCAYLPLCWQGCIFPYVRVENSLKYLDNYCKNIENNYLLKRKLDNIKYFYLEQKREGLL